MPPTWPSAGFIGFGCIGIDDAPIPIGSPTEQTERDCLPDGLVPLWRWMKVIAAVVGGQQPVRVFRIANDCVEVDHAVKVSGGPDPGVYCLSVGFAERAGMVIIGSRVRCDRGSVDP